jgi:hypothetical protein
MVNGRGRELGTLQSFFDASQLSSPREKMISHITEHLSYARRDMRSEIDILCQILERLSAFPFEPGLVAKSLTWEGFFRALSLLTGPAFISSGTTRADVVKRCNGHWIPRYRREEDTKRILFRALATPQVADASKPWENTRYRQIPVTNFGYDLLNREDNGMQGVPQYLSQSVEFVRQEDERTVDLLDAIAAIQPGDAIGSRKRDYTYPARHGYSDVLKTLPSYEFYLDQLLIPRHQFVDFVRLIHLLTIEPGDTYSIENLDNTADELCALFGTDDITWEVFHETTASMKVRLSSRSIHICNTYV